MSNLIESDRKMLHDVRDISRWLVRRFRAVVSRHPDAAELFRRWDAAFMEAMRDTTDLEKVARSKAALVELVAKLKLLGVKTV